jgi:hypothetical protein
MDERLSPQQPTFPPMSDEGAGLAVLVDLVAAVAVDLAGTGNPAKALTIGGGDDAGEAAHATMALIANCAKDTPSDTKKRSCDIVALEEERMSEREARSAILVMRMESNDGSEGQAGQMRDSVCSSYVKYRLRKFCTTRMHHSSARENQQAGSRFAFARVYRNT